ncbi:MAG: DUF6152 family protein [Methyloceanibacter sp.]
MRMLLHAAFLAMLIGALMLGVTRANAHHGWSNYDAEKAIKVEAPVDVVRYQQPHGEIEIVYEGKPWVVVLAPPSRMQARGLPKEDLVVGATVTVEAYPKRNGEAEMRAERITVNGKTVELR